jgi:putative phosphoesterase
MKLGVISDTHGLFDEAIPPIFRGVNAIIHAGDIGRIEVITRLEQIAPVFAVEGNNDSFGVYPEERIENWIGYRVLIRHIFGELHQLPKADKKGSQISDLTSLYLAIPIGRTKRCLVKQFYSTLGVRVLGGFHSHVLWACYR